MRRPRRLEFFENKTVRRKRWWAAESNCGRGIHGRQAFGALQFECNIGDDQRTVDLFERYTDSKAALFHQTESFAPFSKEFFAVAKLTRWVIYGTPSDEFKKANADFHPIYLTLFDGFVR